MVDREKVKRHVERMNEEEELAYLELIVKKRTLKCELRRVERWSKAPTVFDSTEEKQRWIREVLREAEVVARNMKNQYHWII